MLGRLKKLWAKRSSGSWIDYLRNSGMRIGEGTMIHTHPLNVLIDVTRPWLIEIGKNVQITYGVSILTHGYDWATLKAEYGDINGSSGKVTIGDNCFIGINTTILKGTTIGDNVIVGAGSVLTGRTYPSNCVIAGNPAKVICSLEEYHEKRLSKQKEEARELVVEYYKVFGKAPHKSVLSEFFWLFEERRELSEPSFIYQMKNMGNYDESEKCFLSSKPEFNGYDDFVEYCLKDAEV